MRKMYIIHAILDEAEFAAQVAVWLPSTAQITEFEPCFITKDGDHVEILDQAGTKLATFFKPTKAIQNIMEDWREHMPCWYNHEQNVVLPRIP